MRCIRSNLSECYQKSSSRFRKILKVAHQLRDAFLVVESGSVEERTFICVCSTLGAIHNRHCIIVVVAAAVVEVALIMMMIKSSWVDGRVGKGWRDWMPGWFWNKLHVLSLFKKTVAHHPSPYPLSNHLSVWISLIVYSPKHIKIEQEMAIVCFQAKSRISPRKKPQGFSLAACSNTSLLSDKHPAAVFRTLGGCRRMSSQVILFKVHHMKHG